MRKFRRASKDWEYAEFYSSDFLMRSEKNLRLALIIIAVSFFAFLIALACVFILYPVG